MGCTSSKQGRYDLRSSIVSFPRSSSSPSQRRAVNRCTGCGGGYHIVSLKSSTLGTIKLDGSIGSRNEDEPMQKSLNDKAAAGGGGGDGGGDGDDFSSDIYSAKLWSDMIERKIRKTPTMTPPNEPETINVWELMEGLDDNTPIRLDFVERSFSFHATVDVDDDDHDQYKEDDLGLDSMKKTKLANGSPLVRKPIRRQTMSCDRVEPRHSLVKERIHAFQEKINAKKAKAKAKKAPQTHACPPGGDGKVVFYFTSLRGIRKTYEDCCDIQIILRGYGVRIDERDTSMHAVFKEELNEMLGPGFGGCTLPRVFASGRHLGGAEEVREMHEIGKLGKALEGCERTSLGKAGERTGTCELCDGMRFVPCETCSGSCKLYVEEEGGEFGGFRRCPDCNENGLVRCPICCND